MHSKSLNILGIPRDFCGAQFEREGGRAFTHHDDVN